MTFQIPIEYLIAGYQVRYQQLDILIPQAFKGSKANEVNLYIDLYSIYRTVFSRSYHTDIGNNFTVVTSQILNLCGHYKNYFKRIGVYAKIFLISSYNLPDYACKIIPGYNHDMVDKLCNKEVTAIITQNLELLNALCQYINHVYILSTSFESSVLIKKIIEKEQSNGNSNPNIIISSDLYPLQLCSMFPDTVMLCPVKFRGTDESMITLPNGAVGHDLSIWAMIRGKRGQNASEQPPLSISTQNLALVHALNRFPERNIKKLINMRQLEKLIGRTIGNSPIPISVDTLYEANPELYNYYPISQVEIRYRALSVNYGSNLFDESMECNTLHYEDLRDPNALQMINSQYFATNPIDLDRLCY